MISETIELLLDLVVLLLTILIVGVSGSTLSCQANQRIRCTPISIEFNKSFLPVVNEGNCTFFLVDFSVPTALTLTPITLNLGNVSCVGKEDTPPNQKPNSLCAKINNGLRNANSAWGQAGSFHVRVINTPTSSPYDSNFIGNLQFLNSPNDTYIVALRDTNFVEGHQFNSSAHNLLGLALNEVHFSGPIPTQSELAALAPGADLSLTGSDTVCGRPPVLSPLDHVYLRSTSLLPNGLSQVLNGNVSAGFIQSNILCRIPWNEGSNYALSNFGGLTTNFEENIQSGYSGDLSQWMWKNQNGKEFSFFVPSNIITNIQLQLTTFQGTPLSQLGSYEVATGPPLKGYGMGAFVTLRFDI